MKKIVLFVLLGVVFAATSCKQEKGKEKESTESKAYTLTGKFADSKLDGKVVYIQKLADNMRDKVTVDSVTVANGVFTFNDSVKGATTLRFISVGEEYEPSLFVPEGGNIEMTFDTVYTAVVKGTDLNDKFQTFVNKMNGNGEKYDKYYKKVEELKTKKELTKEAYTDLSKEEENLVSEWRNDITAFVKDNAGNALGEYVFLSNSYFLTPNTIKELLPSFSSEFKATERVQMVEKRADNQLNTAVGKPYVDIKGFDINGKPIALSEHVGHHKVLLIDFWASWCGPCRRALPEIKKIYEEYKGKGFSIVSVSLDNDKKAWENGTKAGKITWSQITNLKGWDEDGAVAYGVSSIPQLVLLDEKGNIIARDLNEDSLRFKLEELLSK